MKHELPVLAALIALLCLLVSIWPAANEEAPRVLEAQSAVPPPSKPTPCPELEIVATRCALRFLPGRVPLVLVEWRGRVLPKPPTM